MLTKIEINNFKSFNENFIFDLSDTNSFAFNQECIVNNIVNKAIIYGQNACGKSNLGFAIFDLISHLTDKETESKYYNNYLNANNGDDKATFKFKFKFNNDTVEYVYTKVNYQTLVSEDLIINNSCFASINREKSTIFETTAKGAETLNKDLGDSNISIISYISKNSILKDDNINEAFKKFKKFINGMLYFRSLDDKCYIGFEQGDHYISNDIVKHNNLDDFEIFLNNAGIKCKLISKKVDDTNHIYFKFENKEILFFDIASSGTTALALFYFWYQRLKDNKGISFLFIDEFDAFYHHSLSRIIIEKLKEVIDTQIILTTHNTSIISNDLLRPDCYFLMYEDNIKSLSNRTVKELREAHNIEKMYRAGSFGK
jgi:AAA15 family ATPase/GTPase